MDIQGSTVPSDSTSFEIGSISKVLTGTLLADMVLRGEVHLADPVRKYLPASVRVPARSGRAITLLDLATHTSGLPRDPDNFAEGTSAERVETYSAAKLYSFLSSYSLDRDPGATEEYSNIGIGLLSLALALRGGKSYEALVTERILRPLGMRDTYITPPTESLAREAIGHNVDLEITPPWRLQQSIYQGAGGWHSSMRDMLTLATAVIEQPTTPVGRAIALATTAVQATATPADSNGLGWGIRARNGKRLVYHNGGTDGFSSMLAVCSSDGLAAVVLVNTFVDADVIAWHLVDPRNTLTAPVARAHIELPVTALSRYVGVYDFRSGSRSRISLDGSRLYYEPAGVPRMRLYAESERHFFLRTGRDVEFTIDSAGTVAEIVIRSGERVFRGKRLAP